MKTKLIFALFLFLVPSILRAEEKKPVDVPIYPNENSAGNKNRPRVPAAHPLPVCIYADGILSINFPSPEGEAEIVITHSDFTEEYTVTTEYSAVISTDLYDGDTVEITTEEGNIYIAAYYSN